jgi:hypothetical protein
MQRANNFPTRIFIHFAPLNGLSDMFQGRMCDQGRFFDAATRRIGPASTG